MLWRYREHKHSEPFYENDISLHTILVRGIPKNIPVAEAEKLMNEVFKSIFNS